MAEDFRSKRFCSHCGSMGPQRLGACHICDLSVCEHCGNIQHLRGEKRIVHNECLHKDEDGFSMIKFVK